MTSDSMRADDPALMGALMGDGRSGTGRIVLAAGGIVLTGRNPTLEVLVIHRPAYDDWTLPKGHVDPQEELEETALREVFEETGVRALITGPAGITAHAVDLPGGRAVKQVHWFLMRPDDSPEAHAGSGDGDGEVDRTEWWRVGTALERLTYAGERELLRAALVTSTHPGTSA